MTTTESVSERLADRDVRVLAERRKTFESALVAWRSAVADAKTARENAAVARDAARAADGRADEEELRQRRDRLHHHAERADHVARQVRRTLMNAVDDAEIEALHAADDARRIAPEDAARVGQAVEETLAQMRAARAEARLGPSPEDADLRRCAERETAERAAAAAPTGDSGGPATGEIHAAHVKTYALCPDDTPVYGYPAMLGVLADVFECRIGGTTLKNALKLGRMGELTTPGRALKAGAIANCFTRHKGRRKCKTTYGPLRAYAEWHRTHATR